MPRLSDTMLQGKIIEWFKKEGDPVQEGELLFVVETDKAVVEVNASASGVLLKIIAGVEESISVGEKAAIIGQTGEDITLLLKKSPEPREERVSALKEKKSPLGLRIKASPAAKRLAKDQGIDLSDVKGSGEGGLITEKDVVNFSKIPGLQASPGSSKYGPAEPLPLDGVRKVMAVRMAQSHQQTAPVTTVAETDVTSLEKLGKEKSLTLTSLMIKGVVEAIRDFPLINSSLQGETIWVKKYCNIGISVASSRGLIVPVIHNAESMEIRQISEKIRELAEKARENRLTLEEVSEGTFTVTNSGVFGSLFFTPMIHHPQSAILGMGKVLKQPVVREDQIVIRSMMYLSLSYDHRIIDGETAVRFLQKVKSLLESPQELLGSNS
jgi:pyruvate/2-oxoglutarate dehydrogenase complex dihydrolipoamide acyltransferase (E2) component